MKPGSRSTVPAVALLLLGAACGADPAAEGDRDALGSASRARPKVLVLCVDGASFTVIDELLPQGRLPHLAGLIDRGTRGTLMSADPPKASPVLWGTVFTGADKEAHGILGFTHRVDGNPTIYTSTDRKLPAIWNLVAAEGGTAGVIGPLNTWPAEDLPGYVVTDRLTRTPFGGEIIWTDDLPAMVHPPELLEPLQSVVLQPEQVTREELSALGEFDDAEWKAMQRNPDKPGERHGLLALKMGYATQESVGRIAVHLLETRPQPDLLVVFLELPDRAGHHFWHAYQPELVRGGPSAVHPGWRDRWASVVPQAYALTDAWIGRILERVDEETTVFVVSDHGMRSSGSNGGWPSDLESVVGSGTHAREGVFIAAGPAIRPSGLVDATLWDVAPTVMAALGLPGATQFTGRPQQHVLSADFLRRHPPGPPRDHGVRDVEPVALPDGLDDRYMEQLQAMGYVGVDGVDR